MARRLSIVIQDNCSSESAPPGDRLRAWLESALSGAAHGELTLRIVGDAESAALNERYRGGRGPTNVLAFPVNEPDLPASAEEMPPCGDLVVCAPLVAREAAEQGKAADAHWAHLVVHGMLHLQGYDHAAPAERAEMEGLEIKILGELGYINPYNDER